MRHAQARVETPRGLLVLSYDQNYQEYRVRLETNHEADYFTTDPEDATGTFLAMAAPAPLASLWISPRMRKDLKKAFTSAGILLTAHVPTFGA